METIHILPLSFFLPLSFSLHFLSPSSPPNLMPLCTFSPTNVHPAIISPIMSVVYHPSSHTSFSSCIYLSTFSSKTDRQTQVMYWNPIRLTAVALKLIHIHSTSELPTMGRRKKDKMGKRKRGNRVRTRQNICRIDVIGKGKEKEKRKEDKCVQLPHWKRKSLRVRGMTQVDKWPLTPFLFLSFLCDLVKPVGSFLKAGRTLQHHIIPTLCVDDKYPLVA